MDNGHAMNFWIILSSPKTRTIFHRFNVSLKTRVGFSEVLVTTSKKAIYIYWSLYLPLFRSNLKQLACLLSGKEAKRQLWGRPLFTQRRGCDKSPTVCSPTLQPINLVVTFWAGKATIVGWKKKKKQVSCRTGWTPQSSIIDMHALPDILLLIRTIDEDLCCKIPTHCNATMQQCKNAKP